MKLGDIGPIGTGMGSRVSDPRMAAPATAEGPCPPPHTPFLGRARPCGGEREGGPPHSDERPSRISDFRIPEFRICVIQISNLPSFTDTDLIWTF